MSLLKQRWPNLNRRSLNICTVPLQGLGPVGRRGDNGFLFFIFIFFLIIFFKVLSIKINYIESYLLNLPPSEEEEP